MKALRVNFFKSDRSVSGQNLDHLHTIAIQTGLVHIKAGLSIFDPACSHIGARGTKNTWPSFYVQQTCLNGYSMKTI